MLLGKIIGVYSENLMGHTNALVGGEYSQPARKTLAANMRNELVQDLSRI